MISEKDLQQFKKAGILVSQVEQQIERFKEGFPYLELKKAATIDNGIFKLREAQANAYRTTYEKNSGQNILKFVPASGAASRMFKSLFKFDKELLTGEVKSIEAIKDTSAQIFFRNLPKFAFYENLNLCMSDESLAQKVASGRYSEILKAFLFSEGLNYGTLPKGLLLFHKYKEEIRTAFEEHLVEGALYARENSGRVQLHFTVSPEHMELFREHFQQVKEKYERRFKVKYDIQFSIQKPSTDTIAVDMENNPFRLGNGSILFRPGGHGALLENLNECRSEIIFIKNIDNVVHDKLKETTVLYKKILAGILLEYREKIFRYLRMLDSPESIELNQLKEIQDFVQDNLFVIPDKEYKDKSEILTYLKRKLNRPIRVCGVVKNEGEPGGGPVWAKNPDGTISLQIAESAQVDMNNTQQAAIFSSGTHFNPVDLVCGIYNYKGEKFDLIPFRDPGTGFISNKSFNGKNLKALELPGLWNGAMSDWNTLFVEVPLETFNPVKTINDLLRPPHQSD
ncbi:MAG: DUF4301 family protein [Bacteroidales bacterium]|nr:DUF4301 family protein [Bacteroidales bacterium]